MDLFHKCFHPPTQVVKLDDTTYYGGNEMTISDFEGEFVVNLTRHPNIVVSEGFSSLTSLIEYPFQEIIVPWPDFKLPKVKIAFWRRLHDFIDEKGWKDVCIHCAGGHGRTGTALSALIIANAGLPAKEAVEIVRDNYCNLCVETLEQCFYLQEVDTFYNGRKPKEDACPIPSMFYSQKKDEV
jgi:protein-tyrosine phosphatase